MPSIQSSNGKAEVASKGVRLHGGIPKRSEKVADLVDKLVEDLGGKRAIHRVLIANNGIAAVKFIRSIRQWAIKMFGDDRAISLVALATPEDMKVNAEHIRMADQFCEVGGGSNNNNYANVSVIVREAFSTQSDAVWPGWGHASEFPELPTSLSSKGIEFLGPPAGPMAALGDKVGSTILAQAAGVPTLPWSGTGVSLAYADCGGVIPEDVYNRACIQDVEDAKSACQRIGYPIMLKASWGGGGKGIRMVQSEEQVANLYSQVCGEVPGSPIFAMKLAPQSRHLEVQLLADKYGNVCAVHSRDCSVQRRHQKIVEEGPVSAAGPDVLRAMEVSACELARHVGYVGAATVEYLYGVESKEFYFLELNPRLQVEHPVTEWISDVNLPACQLMIGMGVPLYRIPEIRRLYGEAVDSKEPIEFKNARSVPPRGHVIAVRITSEDPDDGFKPTSGAIDELSFRSTPDVWGYFSVKSSGGIHEFSDSQFGHLFAKGDTRQEAIRSMVVALKDVNIRGEIRTIVDYAVDMLQSDDFVGNTIHTGWLDSRIAGKVKAEKPPWHLAVIAGAVRHATAAAASRTSEYLSYLQKGQIPPKKVSLVTFIGDVVVEGIKYTVTTRRRGQTAWCLELNGSRCLVEARTLRDGGLLMQLDGASHVVYHEKEALGTRLMIDSRTCLLQNEEDPSRIIAITPGKLVRHLVADGSHVPSDHPYAEVEVMKMVMPMLTPAAGVIHFHMPEGYVMAAGELIADLELDDPSAVQRAVPFEGVFPELGRPTPERTRVSAHYEAAVAAARAVMAGYEHPVDEVVRELLACLDHPDLPQQQWQEAMAIAASRMPPKLVEELDAVTSPGSRPTSPAVSNGKEFPASKLGDILAAWTQRSPATQPVLQPLMELAQAHQNGRAGFARNLAYRLFNEYLDVEEHFGGKPEEMEESDVVDELRHQHSNSLQAVVDIVLSRQNVANKTQLVVSLMGALVLPSPAHYRRHLRRFSQLQHPSQAPVALRSQHLLEQSMLGELRAGVARSLTGLDMFAESAEAADADLAREPPPRDGQGGLMRRITPMSAEEGLYRGLAAPSEGAPEKDHHLKMLIEAQAAVDDALAGLITHTDNALDVYVRRMYHPNLVGSVNTTPLDLPGTPGDEAEPCQIATWRWAPLGPGPQREDATRGGVMLLLATPSQLVPALEVAARHIKDMQLGGGTGMGSNTVHVALLGKHGGDWPEVVPGGVSLPPTGALGDSGNSSADDGEGPGGAQGRAAWGLHMAAAVREGAAGLRAADVGVVSLLVPSQWELVPKRYGFRWSGGTQEYEIDSLLRHIEPPIAEQLEVARIASLNPKYCASRSRQYHLYVATEPYGRRPPFRRVFLRASARQIGDGPEIAFTARSLGPKAVAFHAAAQACVQEVSQTLLDCVGELERASYDNESRARQADWAHVFVSALPALPLAVDGAEELAGTARGLASACGALARDNGAVIRRAAVFEWELRLKASPEGGAPLPASAGGRRDGSPGRNSLGSYCVPFPAAVWRVVVSNPSGHNPIVHVYTETTVEGEATYCYDFPRVFGNALEDTWAVHQAATGQDPPHGPLITAREFVLADGKEGSEHLSFVDRPVGANDVGMVAWVLRLRAPEAPGGREIVAIANDVTMGNGSLGPREDAVFRAATQRALEMRVPLVYLAANSGARIGLADEVKSCFKVEWNSEKDPSKGFKYLYLDDADHAKLSGTGAVKARPVTGPTGDLRWMLTDIIGEQDGLGVECLSASGSIASEYSRAYKEGFTITLVSGRCVGIGAYLARLGQRCIQRTDQAIILTGFSALNKVLGREVYSSQMQLGGPRVMATNGVSHRTVDDDLSGARAIVRWISYVPPVLGGPPPTILTMDPADRMLGYVPGREVPCDPRAAIAGVPYDGGAAAAAAAGAALLGDGADVAPSHWAGGIFDRGTWDEAHAGWARTVVTGRARLGGVPVGVVAVETQTVMHTSPADPGMPESSERTIPQAGQVWFPDSAEKTAQAIEEFNREGLPLFILANWRGFSGGQRDLFEGVLQAGSHIVENLRCYKQPVFVYIPPGGELRGGAWVVVDTQINSGKVEMYADPTARGGVLEPEGIVEIKYRKADVLDTMARNDPEIGELAAEAKALKDGGVSDKDPAAQALQQRIGERQRKLMGTYGQVANRFAELHDSPERMQAKGVIRSIVPWAESRRFFTHRLQRRLAEQRVADEAVAADPSLSESDALEHIQRWYESDPESGSRAPGSEEDHDVRVAAWLARGPEVVAQGMAKLRSSRAAKEVMDLAGSEAGRQGLLAGLQLVLGGMAGGESLEAIAKIKAALESLPAEST